MSHDHPCYPHRETCDWCRVCIHGECCDGDGEPEEEETIIEAIARVVGA